jgi:hypothetical protein
VTAPTLTVLTASCCDAVIKRLYSSLLRAHVAWYKLTDVSEVPAASVVRATTPGTGVRLSGSGRWPLAAIWRRSQECVELYLHHPTCQHGVGLGHVTTLPQANSTVTIQEQPSAEVNARAASA